MEPDGQPQDQLPVPAPPRILVNPHLQHCPDYSAPEFKATRNAIAQAHPEEDPVRFLTDSWQALNVRAQAAWDRQEEEDIEQNPRLPSPPCSRRDAASVHDHLRPASPNPPSKPSSSTKSLTYTPGLKAGLIIEKVSSYTRSKLKSRSYVELFYFTHAGITATKTSNASVSEGFGLINTNNGLQLRPYNEFKAYEKVVPDENLTWAQIREAKTHYLAEITDVGWEADIVELFHKFFYALDNHLLIHQEIGCDIMVLYQAEVCKDWFKCAKLNKTLYDISAIDQQMLQECTRRVHNGIATEMNNR